MLHANFIALCFTEPELLLIEILDCGNRNFLLFAPVTLTLTDDLHILFVIIYL